MCHDTQDAHVTLPFTDRAPSTARAFLRDFLRRAHGIEHQDNAALLTTEVVTNAVRHGRAPIRLDAACAGGHLCIRVNDSDPAEPKRSPRDDLDQGGRGIPLLDAIADAWGVRQHPGDGKDVWFTLR